MKLTHVQQFVLACCREESRESFFALPDEWLLDASDKRIYKFTREYYIKYSKFPPVKDVTSKFKLTGKATADPGHYFSEIQNDYVTHEVVDYLPKAVKDFEKDPLTKFTQLKNYLQNIKTQSGDSIDVVYSDGATERYNSYQKRKGTGGVIYLSTGDPILDKIFYGYEPTDLITFGGRAGTMKCLGKGTKVVMYDLSLKNVEDVEVGDQLLGPDGTPRNVLTIGQGREMMYWVHQNKGMSYRVNESHILSLKDRTNKNIRKTSNDRRIYEGSGECSDETVNISIKDYASKSKHFKKYHKGWKPDAMEFYENEVLPIDPYFLGLWLGDGHSRELSVTTADVEISDYLKEFAKSKGFEITQPSSDIIYSLVRQEGHVLLNEFRSLGLMKRRGDHEQGVKHIPQQFLKTSINNRRELLAGLLDSDGTPDNKGYLFAQKSLRLVKDVENLCRTLGIFTSRYRRTIEGEIYYHLILTGDFSEVPLKIGRKKVPPRIGHKHHLRTGITVEKDCEDDYYGFTLDGDHLFLLEDFTVTHNTWLLIKLALLTEVTLPDGYGPILFITNEMSVEQITERVDCARFELCYEDYLKGELDPKKERKYRRGLKKLESDSSPLIILDNVRTLADLEEKMVVYQPSICFVDGSYLLEPQMEEGYSKTTFITRNLKRVAKDFKIPLLNTTQLRKSTGKKQQKSSADAQDDFYHGSYSQDSDFAIRMFRDARMELQGEVGMGIAKGRRVPPGTEVLWKNNFYNTTSIFELIEPDITLVEEEDEDIL